MADKETCPACNAHLSSIREAFMKGEDCPVCGLPADAAAEFVAARERGADKSLTERLVKLSAALAERDKELVRLRTALRRAKQALEEAGVP